MNKKPVAIDVIDERTANGFRIISCSGFLNKQQREKALFPVDSDLVLVRLAADDGGGEGYPYHMYHVYIHPLPSKISGGEGGGCTQTIPPLFLCSGSIFYISVLE